MPGIWRLRLPLPWPGVPHCNAYAVAAGDGVVLFDCGLHEPGSLAQLERAMEQVGLRLSDVRLLVCTHAHADHYGQAASVVDASGCELWMHPADAHMRAQHRGPRGAPGAPLRGRAPERRAARAAARVVGRRARARQRDRAARRARPRARGRRRRRHRPRPVDGRRDARPRALARLPAPARAPPARLRRPPARPRLAVLRLRLDARPGRRVPRLAGRGRRARRAPVPRPATGARSPTCAPTSTPTARSSPSGWSACGPAVAEHGPITAYDIVPLLHGEALTQLTAGWWLPETLVLPAPSRGDRRRGARAGRRDGALGARGVGRRAAWPLSPRSRRARRARGSRRRPRPAISRRQRRARRAGEHERDDDEAGRVGEAAPGRRRRVCSSKRSSSQRIAAKTSACGWPSPTPAASRARPSGSVGSAPPIARPSAAVRLRDDALEQEVERAGWDRAPGRGRAASSPRTSRSTCPPKTPASCSCVSPASRAQRSR